MVARQRLRHSQWQSPSIGQIKGIGRFQLRPPLVFNVLTAPFGRSMATVMVDAGEVKFGPVPVQELYPTLFSRTHPCTTCDNGGIRTTSSVATADTINVNVCDPLPLFRSIRVGYLL